MKNTDKPIYVTQPALPPLNEFNEYLKKIWDNKFLTNNGPFHQEFEKKLANYLGVKYISVFSNGTLALLTAMQSLQLKGEVITTPFSFVATTHALWWNNIKPVFADIEPRNFNLDPKKVEAAITPKTTGILPVHIYGYPCDTEHLQKIADKHNLKILYDAAHAFNVEVNGNSVLNFGDLSILSFHATKVFNTLEGGAIISHNKKSKDRIDLLKNFGFADETTIVEPGINAKMNELQAAYGLLQMKYVDEYISKRKSIVYKYREGLSNIKGLKFLNDMDNVHHNYSYFPIFINKNIYGKSRDDVYEKLKNHNIYGRRYFYPLISQISMYKKLSSANIQNLPIANKAADQVICIPLYPDLNNREVDKIIDLLKN